MLRCEVLRRPPLKIQTLGDPSKTLVLRRSCAYDPHDVRHTLCAGLRFLRRDEGAQVRFPAPGRERLELPQRVDTERLSQIVRDLERLDAVEERPRPVALRGPDL